MANTTAKHFVLIHGVCHGAWCWYTLVAMLMNAGHRVTTIDLAASGINLERLEDVHSYNEYHEPLFLFMERLPPQEKVILVGHSLGGVAISSATEMFPEKIACAVYVSAVMVGPQLTVDQINFRIIGSSPDAQSIKTFARDELANKLYQNSPPQDLELALLLVRVAKFYNDKVSKSQLLVTEERFGSVRRAYVIGGSDLSIPVDAQKWMIENSPPDEVHEIEGADHMVMISKPQELCNILLQIAQTLNST